MGAYQISFRKKYVMNVKRLVSERSEIRQTQNSKVQNSTLLRKT